MSLFGGGGKGVQRTEGSKELEQFTKEFREQSAPVRTEVFRQVQEALTTGGVGARIPIIQKSVEASKAAQSTAIRGVEADLARTGLDKTPFGVRLLAETRQRGEAATGSIPTQVAGELINVAPGLATGSVSSIISGFGTSGQLDVGSQQVAAERQRSQLALLASLFGNLGGLGGKLGKAAALGPAF